MSIQLIWLSELSQTDQFHKTFVVTLLTTNHDFDYQYHFAYEVFKEAKYISVSIIAIQQDKEDAFVMVFHVTCTFRNPEEEQEYLMYGDPSEDFNDF